VTNIVNKIGYLVPS